MSGGTSIAQIVCSQRAFAHPRRAIRDTIYAQRRGFSCAVRHSCAEMFAIPVQSESNNICSMIEHIVAGVLTDEYRIKILRILEQDPDISQRDLARNLGISLGRANFCLQALIDKGWIKVNNFKNSNNKKAYMYLLTRRGIAEKARVTTRFLERKVAEYEALKREIEQLQREAHK